MTVVSSVVKGPRVHPQLLGALGTGLLLLFDSDVEGRMWVKGEFRGSNISSGKMARGGGPEALRVINRCPEIHPSNPITTIMYFLPFGSLCFLLPRNDRRAREVHIPAFHSTLLESVWI